MAREKQLMNLKKKIYLYFWTLKFLKIEQIFYRIKYLFMNVSRIKVINNPVNLSSWTWSSPQYFVGCYDGKNTFNLLNKKIKFCGPIGWNDGSIEKLWLYNLHYFDDLNAIDSVNRVDAHYLLIKNWIENNPLSSGGIGWEPYTLSIRLVNWIKWCSRHKIDDADVMESIYSQAQVLSKTLEYHILGNHLLSNAKALMFVGYFFEGKMGKVFLNQANKIFERELIEQFLEDGGQFELSPMYTGMAVFDILDLINIGRITSCNENSEQDTYLCRIAQRGLFWLQIMSHPDGDVSFFNDSSKGIAPKISFLLEYASTLGIEPSQKIDTEALLTLKNSGYSRISIGESVLLFDHANIGPDYLPGHSHADNLSVEWSIGVQRVLVNSGTSLYGVSSERHRQRKTSCHNTVEVDGFDSSEIWSGFRVARRAYSSLESSQSHSNSVRISASHNGYKRLSGKVTHTRTIDVTSSDINIIDKLDGRWRKACGFFHFHPDIVVKQLNPSAISLMLPSGLKILMETSGIISVQASTWHPAFGVAIDNTKCLIAFKSNLLKTVFSFIRNSN
jgi:uncharacterized heparinase superfamily protein